MKIQLARIEGGIYAAPAKLTVGEFLTTEWLPAVESTLRPLSVTKYRSAIRLYVVPNIGGTRLQALSGGTRPAQRRPDGWPSRPWPLTRHGSTA